RRTLPTPEPHPVDARGRRRRHLATDAAGGPPAAHRAPDVLGAEARRRLSAPAQRIHAARLRGGGLLRRDAAHAVPALRGRAPPPPALGPGRRAPPRPTATLA